MHKLQVMFLIAAMLCCALTSTFAQTDTLRNEVGFGTNILFHNFFNSTSAPFDLMYRRHSGKGFVRIGGAVSLHSDQEVRDFSSNYKEWHRIEINLGKEWRADLASRWQLNYGSDITASYYKLEEERHYRHPEEGRRNFNYDKKQEYGAGLRPFLGLLFKLNKRLLLGTEASLKTGIQRIYFVEEGYSFSNGEFQEDLYPGDGASWRLFFYSSPASNILVYYRF
jgi:hypothetical protein